MNTQEEQALAELSGITERLTRIETRLCKLMVHLQVDPSTKDGYRKPEPPAHDWQAPVRYWPNN